MIQAKVFTNIHQEKTYVTLYSVYNEGPEKLEFESEDNAFMYLNEQGLIFHKVMEKGTYWFIEAPSNGCNE